MKDVFINDLTTEKTNPKTVNIDTLNIKEILTLINEEDKLVPQAIAKEIPNIEKVVEEAVKSFLSGGRLIYLGAGTSGRLGVLDASECPPTFGVSSDMVVGLIAGGDKALRYPIEGAEDSFELGEEDLKNLKITEKDTVIGIAASGRTPYVIGALNYANKIGSFTASVSSNQNSEISKIAKVAIAPVTGEEVITGSTRMKSGTAQKLILNMITTTAMIKIGKVYGNLMVDVLASNSKLVVRQINIVSKATGIDEEEAKIYLNKANNNSKLAIFMILSNLEKEEAESTLNKNNGFIRKALEEVNKR